MNKKSKILISLLLALSLVLGACTNGTEESSEESSLSSEQSSEVPSEQTSEESSEEVSGEESTEEGQAGQENVSGTYEGEGLGYLNPIKVSVSLEEGEITDIELVEHDDTERMFNLAWEYTPAAIIEHQSLEIDAFAGATGSSFGIIRAVEDALNNANVNVEAYKEPVEYPEPEVGEDEEVDILIVGAGASGLSAAIEARKNEEVDANVLVLEKMSYTGGSLGLSGGLFWTGNGSKYTPEDDFTPPELVEWFEMRSEVEVNEPFVTHLAEFAPEKFDYLIDNGAPWDYENPTETYPDSGIYRFETDIAMSGEGEGKFRSASAGALASDWMADFAEERGAEIRTSSEVTSIITDDSGAAIGVEVQSPEKIYNVYADKIIIATGGFANSKEHLERFAEDSVEKWPFAHAGNVGQGHDMLEEVGATFTGNGVMAYEALTPSMGYKGNLGSLVWVPELVVNQEGQRFVDETGQSTDIALETYLQTDDISYGIIDSQTDRVEDLEEGVEKDLIYKADTLEDLAVQLELTDVDAFVQTVEDYNAAAAGDQEDKFGADPELMKPVEEGPYYAVPLRACIIGTMPGVVVDENAQVLDENGEPIGNLYAAGEVMFGNVFNRVYPATGTAIASAIYSGAIAAEHAVENLNTEQ